MTAPTPNFIWSIADILRGVYAPKEYGHVILPFTVLARLDAVLAPTKEAVLAVRDKAENQPDLLKHRTLTRASGQSFYNTSSYTLHNLGDPNFLAANLKDLVAGFDPHAKDIFEKFDPRFDDVIDKLDAHDLLQPVLSKFLILDVHPDSVDNFEMGQIFEELIRRFMESSKEEAGEFFTPREVIRLMVSLILTPDKEDLANPHKRRHLYDPACGTGGMLSVADEWVHDLNPDARLELAGQEIMGRTFAIAKADMLIKGQDVNNLKYGNTLTNDLLLERTFSYALSNPPYGVDWKAHRATIEAERERDGDKSRFAAGLPPVSDGQMLFLQHLVHKLTPASEGGGRGAIIMNGSPLFTGGAESGPSEIRRWLFESDLVEAIIGLPTDMFYNTGIATYIWIIDTKKAPERAGKVQLIDATNMFVRLRKGLGSKRRELSPANIAEITRLYGEFEDADPELSKVLPNEAFGYRTITVEQPLRQVFEVTEEAIDAALALRQFKNIDDDVVSSVRQAALSLGSGKKWTRREDFQRELGPAVARAGVAIKPNQMKALEDAFAISSPDGELVTDRKKSPLPDVSLRDTENVPLDEDIDEYLKREIQPWVPDVWIDHSRTKFGYEIPFTRIFYKYVPPRPLAEIDADVQAAIAKVEALFEEVKR